jgi:hypothetical protein
MSVPPLLDVSPDGERGWDGSTWRPLADFRFADPPAIRSAPDPPAPPGRQASPVVRDDLTAARWGPASLMELDGRRNGPVAPETDAERFELMAAREARELREYGVQVQAAARARHLAAIEAEIDADDDATALRERFERRRTAAEMADRAARQKLTDDQAQQARDRLLLTADGEDFAKMLRAPRRSRSDTEK